MSLTVTSCHDPAEWDALVDDAGGHPLQLWGWGELKARYEWSADRLVVRDGDTVVGSAQVLLRRLPAPFRSLAYVPRGPQAAPEHRGAVLDAVAAYLRAEHKPIALTIEPDWEEPFSPLPKGETEEALAAGRATPPAPWVRDIEAAGFRRSENTGLIPRTLIVDVTRDEDTILKELSSTTRQNVRKSFRAENVRFGEVTDEADLRTILEINRETARRAEFAVHDDDYHRGIRDLMGERSQLLAAWEGDEPVAFVWLVVSGSTAFELYGGVSPRGMKLRLNYGLKFHAMKHVKAQGVQRYDFNGLLNDGISDFKRQFAKHEDLLIGTWDKPLSPLYPAFATALPLVRSGLKRGVPAVKKAVRDPGAAADELRQKVRERRTTVG
ncbi:peptidoglycan bridge formation glycyltransferase FemA/FemB family protein [Luteipulveratus sp. YIM 133132]|uniref:lipid II:glycine glycyltransferase FemX n=1 Tax=Luteipulveratus flavus TaxID=3031728 RepID=UPI0023AF16A7|nr:peptidoglycan bridge formation glycyltransferase FemA/FemB family protein [Luteipulveratus sp. YIM 133132]MDE9367493.1 peptidoglycan bridge formation glycyltransferase FemA/FemB family protein [Luteipulveratus sp. YIM 133132]